MSAFYHSGPVAIGRCLQRSDSASAKSHILHVQLVIAIRFTQIERAPINLGKTSRDILIERILVDFPHRPEGPGFVATFPSPKALCS